MNPHLLQLSKSIFALTHQKELYDFQEALLKDGGRKRRIVLKSRQLGITTVYALFAYVSAAYLGKKVIIVSPSERQSNNFMDYVQAFYQASKGRFPTCDVLRCNNTILEFKDRGRVTSLPNSPNTIRGLTADIIIFDEMALFMHDTDREIMEAVLPMLSRGGQIIMISTPYGERGLFYEYCMKEAENVVRVHYSQCPGLDIESIRVSMDEVSFQQEYDCAFIGDTASYFPYELIHSCVGEGIVMIDEW